MKFAVDSKNIANVSIFKTDSEPSSHYFVKVIAQNK